MSTALATAQNVVYVFNLPGGGQSMVTVYSTGLVTMAFRPHEGATWGAPIRATRAETF